MNDLLYRGEPRFGGEAAMWQPQEAGAAHARLILPTVLGTGSEQYGERWWPSLVAAVHDEDRDGVERFERQIRRTALLIAYRRGLLGVAHRARPTPDDDRIVPLDDVSPALLSIPAPADAFNVIEQISAALGNDRAVRAALLATCEGWTLKEIGRELGVEKSQADRLVKTGMTRLRDYPNLRMLLEID